MTKDTVKNYRLYRLRFWIGYLLLASLVLAVFVLAATYVPGGITPKEQDSALTSASLNLAHPTSFLIVDMPYHALQKLSLYLFDLNSFAIKLPSLIVGFVTAIALVLVLRRRFSQTASIVAAGIVVVSALFISLVSSGTPDIMLVLWPALFLLVAAYAIDGKKLRTPAFLLAGAFAMLSVFTPYMLSLVVIFCLTAILHPRIRYMLRKAPRSALGAGLVLACIGVATISLAIYYNPALLSQLIYRSDSYSLDILANLKLIAYQTMDFASASISKTGLLAPIFGLCTLIFACIGARHLIVWRHSAVSYLVALWLLCITPIVLLNPLALHLYIVPIALLIASGIGAVLNYWYRLFPQNPYARIFALVPLTILFACIIIPGALRYFYSYHYLAPLANNSSPDLALVAREVNHAPSATLLVASSEINWYRLYLDTHKNTTTKLATDISQVSRNGTIITDTIATRNSPLVATGIRPERIVATSTLHSPSDRVYLYKKTAK